MRIEARQKKVKLRKNFFPTLLVTILLWLLLAGLVGFIDPFTFGVVPLFLLLGFLALLFTFSFLFTSTRKGLTLSTAAIVFLILSYFEVGNILNMLLIIGVVISLEIYFYRKL